MRDPNPFALDTFTVMQNANRLHGREHRELIDYHNTNLCDGNDETWLDAEESELTILDEVESFEAFWLEKME